MTPTAGAAMRLATSCSASSSAARDACATIMTISFPTPRSLSFSCPNSLFTVGLCRGIASVVNVASVVALNSD